MSILIVLEIEERLRAVRPEPSMAPRPCLPANFFWYDTTVNPAKVKKLKKTFRNPIIQAKEMQLEMEYHDLTKAQLARKLNADFPAD